VSVLLTLPATPRRALRALARLRREAAHEIERLIAVVDQIDGHADLESDQDAEVAASE
jgi:D-serine deaminase-like pyridoxal phosphate-dependent protein